MVGGLWRRSTEMVGGLWRWGAEMVGGLWRRGTEVANCPSFTCGTWSCDFADSAMRDGTSELMR